MDFIDLNHIKTRADSIPAKGESSFLGLALPIPATTELWMLRQLAREDVPALVEENLKLRKTLSGLLDLAAEAQDKGMALAVMPELKLAGNAYMGMGQRMMKIIHE